jgi:DNA-binding response OmpR family regulator
MAGKILIVEDDVRLADIFARLLNRAGYDISQAETSKQGIMKALAERPDLIVTDLHLPDMVAIEAITILKNDRNTSDIPVIVLTAESATDWKTKAFEVGAVEYLRKPISPEDLMRLVRRFCPPLVSEF